MESYFLTHGRGLRDFVVEELHCKKLLAKNFDDKSGHSLNIVEEFEGKILFDTNLPLESLLGLKTVERLFLLVFFNNATSKQILHESSPLDLITDSSWLGDSHRFTRFVKSNYPTRRADRHDSAKRARHALSFRVDCKLTGKWKKLNDLRLGLSTQIAETIMQQTEFVQVSSAINRLEPDFCVHCHLTDSYFLIGVAVSHRPLSQRAYIKNVGLRSTVCASMIRLALRSRTLNEFAIIMDPFCGQSTIQTEFLQLIVEEKSHRAVHGPLFVCSDRNVSQMKGSIENLGAYPKSAYDFVLSSLRENLCLPYRDESVDLIISDLPFGKNHKIFCFADSASFYNKTLREFDRILVKSSGLAVLLLSSIESPIFERQLNELQSNNSVELKIVSKNCLSLGETSGQIYKLDNK